LLVLHYFPTRRSSDLRLRSSLNLYSRILHNRYPCGLSAYQCFDHLLPRKNEPTVSLKWVNITETPYPLLEQARNVARTLQERSKDRKSTRLNSSHVKI